MTTLRDYILDCRCPNCGLSMKQAQPKRKTLWQIVTPFLVVVLVIVSAVSAFEGDFAHAAYNMAVATFLVVTDR